MDHPSLAQLLTVEVLGTLGVECAALLLPRDHHLVTVPTDTAPGNVRLPVSHAAVRWVASAGEAQRADRGKLAEIIRQGPVELAWTRIWIPLMRGSDLRGMWLLGPRHNKRDYI